MAAAKIEPVSGYYVAYLNPKIEQDIRDRVAAADAPVRPKLSARAVRPDEPLTFEEEATSPLEAALWRATLAEQPVKKKRGRPRKKDAV